MKLFTNENKLFMNFVENNDFDSFQLLFNQTSPWLYRCIFRIVANKQLAEDILQDTWTIIIEHKNDFDPEKGNLTNLMFTIAKNFALKEIAKTKDGLLTNNSYLIETSTNQDCNPEELLNISERNKILSKAISKLKKEYQDVIIMYYFGDLSIKEIAESLGHPENTIKTDLSRARKKIETILKNDSHLDLKSLLEILMVVKI